MYVLAASFGWFAGAVSAVGGAALAVAGFILNTRRENRKEHAENDDRQEGRRDVARDEAIDLSNVRGEALNEVRRELAELRERYDREHTEQLSTIADLQRTVDLTREQAFETLQMYAHGQRALLIMILGDLERDPPNITSAVDRIHSALNDRNPKFPGQSATT